MNKVINVRERYRNDYQKPKEDERDYEDFRFILSRYRSEDKLREVFFDKNKNLINIEISKMKGIFEREAYKHFNIFIKIRIERSLKEF